MTLLNKTRWSAISSVMNAGGRFGATVAAARILGPEHSGVVVLLLWISEFLGILCSFGLHLSLTRFAAELQGQRRQDASEALAIHCGRVFFGLILLGALAIVPVTTHVLHQPLPLSAALVLPLLFVSQALTLFYLAYLTGRQDFPRSARLNSATAASLFILVTLGSYTFGVTGAIAGYCAATIFPALLCLRLIFRKTAPWDPTLTRRFSAYTFNTWIAALLSAIVWSRTEIYFLERFWGPSAVAMFSVGSTLSALAVQVPMLMCSGLLPHFSQLNGAQEMARLQATYRKATRLMALALFPATLGIASMMPALIPLLYGARFHDAIPAATVMVASASLLFMTVGSSLVYALEKSGFIAITGFAGAILSAGGCLLAVPHFGPLGAATSSMVVKAILAFAGATYLHRSLRVGVPMRALSRTFAAALASAVLSAVAIRSWGGLPGIVLAATVFLLSYGCLLRLLGAIDPEDLPTVLKVAGKLPRQLARPSFLMLSWLRPAA
jgi:O-antigen/teichoic acid export membrane protein